MTALDVDASVCAKWYFDENLSDRARGVTSDDRYELIAPDFVLMEASNVFVTRVRRAELTQEMASEFVESLGQVLALYPAGPLLAPAMEIANAFDRGFYESLYVALALEQGCQLITADERLYNALAEGLPDTMIWLGSLAGASES